jgi:hypothetical protein
LNLDLAFDMVADLKRATDQMQVCLEFEQDLGHADAE